MKFSDQELEFEEYKEPETETINYEEAFDYLGELKTQIEIYKDFYVTEEKQEEEIEVEQDIKEEELEDIVRKKKLADMGLSQLEQVSTETKERWEIAKLFPTNQIRAMLAYQNMFS